MRALVLLAMTIVASAPFADRATAQTLRCRNEFVELGATMASVLQKCGEPATRASTCVVPHTRNADGRTARPDPERPCIAADELTYRPGYGQRDMTLHFENDKLQAITYGARR